MKHQDCYSHLIEAIKRISSISTIFLGQRVHIRECIRCRYEKLKWWIRACPTVMGRNERRISPWSKVRVFVLYFVAAERKSAPPLSCLPQWCLIPSSKTRGCAVINDYKVFRTDDYQSAPDAPAVPLHNFRDFDVHAGSCFLPHCTDSYNRSQHLYRVLRKRVCENLKERSNRLKKTFNICPRIFSVINFVSRNSDPW